MSWRVRNARCFVAFVLLTSLPAAAALADASGVVYHPRESLLEVKVETTRTTTRHLSADCTVQEAPSETYTVDVQLRQVAQSACKLDLGRQKGRWATGGVTANFSPEGLLTGINSSSEGQGGAAIQSVFQLVGGVGGLLTGLPSLTSRLAGDTESKQLHPKVRCFIEKTEQGELLDELVRGQRDLVRSLRAEHLELAKSSAGLEKPDELAVAGKRLGFLRGQIEEAEKDAATYAARFEKGLADYQQNLRLGSTTKTEERVFRLGLNDLEPSSTFASVEMSGSSVRSALSKQASKDLYAATGVVLTLGPLTGSPPAATATGGSCPVTIPSPPKKTAVSVYYRNARTYRLQIYAPTKSKISAPKQPNLVAPRDVQLVGQETVDVFHPNAPLHLLALESKAFGKRSVSVAFGNNGKLTQVADNVEKAAGADLLGALSAGPGQLVSSYASVLDGLAATEESRQKVLLGGLNDEVARLQKEKERVDAEIALNGVEGNRDLLERQARLEQEIATLQQEKGLRDAEFSLEVAETTYQSRLEQQRLAQELALLEAQLGFENAEATFALKLELTKLQAQVELLQKQLELRQAETTLDSRVEQELLTLQLANMQLRVQLETLQRQLEELLEDAEDDEDSDPEEPEGEEGGA